MPGLLVCVLAAASTCTPVRPYAATSGPLGTLESEFLRTRSLADQIDVARAQGKPAAGLEPWYRDARSRLLATLARTDSTRLAEEDRRALRAIRTTTRASLGESPAPAVGDATPEQADCGYDATALLQSRGPAVLGDRIMSCYGKAASAIPWDGKVIDRLTVFALLGETEAARRERLWLTLDPVWRSVNGDGGAASPWRVLLRARAERWGKEGLPHVERARSLGVDPDSLAPWLERVLEAWRAAQPDTTIEPWDWYHFTGAAERRLSSRVSRDDLLPVTRKWFRSLGADPERLRIQFDLDPRTGKYPVAYTTFGDRPREDGKGDWWPGAPAVFATYRIGGLGNLVELLHETGHGIHIAGIRTRPAFADWPDSDTFTEAVADLASLDAYEPRWQVRMLGDSVPLAESLRSKYSGVILDVAWALFELRMFAAPDQDPNAVWTGITFRFLRIRHHTERSWWAMRGQLVDGPGYMLNYALGAILTAQLRARIRDLRGTWTEGDETWYPWVREALFRFGQEKPTSDVVMEFLGGPVRPEALLGDLVR